MSDMTSPPTDAIVEVIELARDYYYDRNQPPVVESASIQLSVLVADNKRLQTENTELQASRDEWKTKADNFVWAFRDWRRFYITPAPDGALGELLKAFDTAISEQETT